jgi:hypothetical protein
MREYLVTLLISAALCYLITPLVRTQAIRLNEIDFTINIKELVRILGWARFEILIFHTNDNNVESLLSEYDELGCLQGVLNARNLYSDFLDTIIK